MKPCSTCKEMKPESDFYRCKESRDGLTWRCKACTNASHRRFCAKNVARLKVYRQQRQKTIPGEVHRGYRLKRLFGLTIAQYDEMLASQDGRCAICGTDKPGGKGAFHVDHDHKTGQVRGLLCSPCNTGIGQLGDDPMVLFVAMKYLEAR